MFHRIDDALAQVLPALSHRPRARSLRIYEAVGRIAARDVVSPIDLPPKPKAVVDGYAVRSEDVSGASRESPVVLKLVGSVRTPFEDHGCSISLGECVAIETGCFLPRGSDAVVMLEDTERIGDRVLVMKSVGKYENVSLPGEELARGDTLVKRGSRIRPWHIAALELCGFESVEVLDLRALVVATGTEFLKTLHKPYTATLVKYWLLEWGFTGVDVEIVGDDVREIAKTVERGVEAYDIVVALGGTSLGSKDFTVRALEALNPAKLVHGLALQPGRTTAIAAIDGKPVVAMSGLPVAALANLELVLNPLLSRWLSVEELTRPRVLAKLAARIPSKIGFRTFARVKVVKRNNEFVAEPTRIGGSGAMRSILLSNGYVVVPEDKEGFDRGEVVEVVLYGSIEEAV